MKSMYHLPVSVLCFGGFKCPFKNIGEHLSVRSSKVSLYRTRQNARLHSIALDKMDRCDIVCDVLAMMNNIHLSLNYRIGTQLFNSDHGHNDFLETQPPMNKL